MLKLQVILLVVVTVFQYSVSAVPGNLTIINELRDFKPLFLGGNKDYFISKQIVNIEDAEQTCQSIGSNFHLVAFETDVEYRKILPYLRSFDLELVWTSGQKIAEEYMWTFPTPSKPTNYTNFPSASRLKKKLHQLRERSKSNPNLPRCKNGLLIPKCDPGNCDVTLDPCSTITPECTITNTKPCTATRPECGATCNNCTVENPVCTVFQDPCTVVTKPCQISRPPCSISTPECQTTRPPCYTINPPCEVTTPQPCTTTPRPCTTETICTTTSPPCQCEGQEEEEGKCKCPEPVTECKPTFRCEEPLICQPGAIICPAPIIVCPPEQTTCSPPELICPPKPSINCPEPEVTCPEPRTICSPAKVTCDAPTINCPGIIINCPQPSFHCPSPIVNCPAPNVECDDFIPCPIPEIPDPCPSNNPNDFIDETEDDDDENSVGSSDGNCGDDCETKNNACIALRKESDFQWKLEDCSQQHHFICEGYA